MFRLALALFLAVVASAVRAVQLLAHGGATAFILVPADHVRPKPRRTAAG